MFKFTDALSVCLMPDHQPLRDLWGHSHRLLVCGVVVNLHNSAGQDQQEVPSAQSRGDKQSEKKRQEVHSWDAAWGWVLVRKLGSVLHLCCLVWVSHPCQPPCQPPLTCWKPHPQPQLQPQPVWGYQPGCHSLLWQIGDLSQIYELLQCAFHASAHV